MWPDRTNVIQTGISLSGYHIMVNFEVFLSICETSKPTVKTKFRTEFSGSQNSKSVFWLFIGSKIFFCITELWMNGISVEKCETPKNRPLNWGFLAGLHPTYTAVLWHGIEKRKKGSLNKFSQAIQKSILIKGFRFSTEGFTRKNSIL